MRPGFAAGKPYSFLSKECRAKRKRLVAEVWAQLGGKPQPMGHAQLSYTIYPATKKLPDVDAYEKELLDGLALAGVIVNDRQFLQVSKERLDPDYPGRLEVEIREIP